MPLNLKENQFLINQIAIKYYVEYQAHRAHHIGPKHVLTITWVDKS